MRRQGATPAAHGAGVAAGPGVAANMQRTLDEAEAQKLIAWLGPTVERECQFNLDERGYAYWWQATALVRRAEVVMVVQRPDGWLLLHTKAHYPAATYRLPTGGIWRDEPVLDALARELWEELGVRLPPVAMPGLVRYTLHYQGRTIPFASFIFFLRVEPDARLVPQDDCEAISDLCWVEPSQLPAVANQLRQVDRAWGDWGRFRAIAHDVVVEALRSRR